MKKIYMLAFLLLTTLTFGQTIYSENMGTPTATTAIAAYIAGTAPAKFQNASPIVYSGNSDVRNTTPSSYMGASAGGNIYLTSSNPVRTFQIDGIDTSAYTAANLKLSFGVNLTVTTALPTVEYSTNGTTWTTVAYPTPAAAGWSFVTTASGVLASSTTLSLRFTQPSPQSALRLDDIKVFNLNSACPLVLNPSTTTCDAITSGIDTYTATIPYTGAGSGTYTITPTAGTVSGDNPNTIAAGNILISGIAEGTAVTVNIVNGACSYSSIVSPANCKVVNTLPFYDGFAYTPASALGNSQMWSTVNTGDDIVAQSGSLIYSGTPSVTTTGNSITFTGTGAESFTPLTATTSGTIYSSFLLNVSDVSTMTADLSSTYFASFTDVLSSNYKARIFVKKNGSQYQLGLDTAATTSNFDTTLRNVGEVLRVVTAYDFTANTLSLWINPATSGSIPVVSITPTVAITTLAGFILRQDTAVLTPTIQLDELRITTNIVDLGLTSLSTKQFNEIAGFNMYPNPATGGKLFFKSEANSEKAIAIYDIIGKQIINQTVTNEINISTLTSGIYVVKVIEDGKTATRKLIVR